MNKTLKKYFTPRLKRLKSLSDAHKIHALLEFKSELSKDFYPYLISIFKSTYPDTYKMYTEGGRLEYRDLLWSGVGASSSIEDELEFAIHWIKDSVNLINTYRESVLDIQESFFNDDASTALNKIEEFKKLYGWTIFGVELEFAIKPYVDGWTNSKKYFSELSESSANRPASLLSQILKERNDDTVSIDHFLNKCKDSFGNDKKDMMKIYFMYRSSGILDDDNEKCKALLCCDIMNSIFDYYESIIEVLSSLKIYNSSNNNSLVYKYCEKIINLGVNDYRIKKLALICGMNPIHFEGISTHENDFSEIFFNRSKKNISNIKKLLIDKLYTVKKSGIIAQDEITNLLKMGLNLRNLPIGVCLAYHAVEAANDYSKEPFRSLWTQINNINFNIVDLTAFPYEKSIEYINLISGFDKNFKNNSKIKTILDLLDWDENTWKIEHIDEIYIWGCLNLIHLGHYEKVVSLTNNFTSYAQPWKREAIKIRVLALSYIEKFEAGVKLSGDLISKNYQYAFELPLDNIISKNKWKKFNTCDPMLVAYVAHYAYGVSGNSNARYICSMACRYIYKNNYIDNITNTFLSLQKNEKAILISFLYNVLVVENLSMVGFESTSKVNEYRLKILQTLLQIGDEPEKYAEDIRELTLAEKLLSGLHHVNQTKIFVNESAITRWAEKEILVDYEKWIKSNLELDYKTKPIDDLVISFIASLDSTTIKSLNKIDTLTESDATIYNISDRLLKKFLYDSADGLDSYLSSRIRHGTLKGTLLGPLEEAGLIGVTTDELKLTIQTTCNLEGASHIEKIFNHLKTFERNVSNIVKRVISEEIQIRSQVNQKGIISCSIDYHFSMVKKLAESNNFLAFINGCYLIFWANLRTSLHQISNRFENNIKNEIQDEFDKLQENIIKVGINRNTLIPLLRSIATETQTKCDLISKWFTLDSTIQNTTYELKEAIEIAEAYTKNIYRLFPIENITSTLDENTEKIPLTPLSLSGITDVLYVMLENAWKHSGLVQPHNLKVDILASFNSGDNVLSITVINPLSEERYQHLLSGEFAKISQQCTLDKAANEGGSGLSKLLKLTQNIDKEKYPSPLTLKLQENLTWLVSVYIKLRKKGDSYDAYF